MFQVFAFMIIVLAFCKSSVMGFGKLSSRPITSSFKSSIINHNNIKIIDARFNTQIMAFDFDNMMQIDNDPTTLGILFAATLIPALIIVKFVGDAADSSRGSLSDKTKNDFKKKMMQQPVLNLSIPTTEEEELKKQITKAYIQDKDVDVAVLEEKLRKRAQWRKEVLLQAKRDSSNPTEDDEGW